MAKDYSQVNFRIPTKLKEQIEQSALENERSITAELVARLEKSFDEPKATTKFDEDVVKQLLANSMKDLLLALNNQGVEGQKILDALNEITDVKKAP